MAEAALRFGPGVAALTAWTLTYWYLGKGPR